MAAGPAMVLRATTGMCWTSLAIWTQTPTVKGNSMATLGKVFGTIGLVLLAVIGVLLAIVAVVLMWFNIPGNAAGMAAKSVCSATFVAGRPADAQALMQEDVVPAFPAVLSLIATDIDEENRAVTSRLFAIFDRTAAYLDERGCVLDAEPNPETTPYQPVAAKTGAWPNGDQADAADAWPDGVDGAGLQQVVEQAFVGEGDPEAANARGVAVVQDGKLLITRTGTGLEEGTALHGWSMTKTVTGMLAFKVFEDRGISWDTPVVDAFTGEREPDWAADWRTDERANITIADLFYMRDGLANDEGYEPWDPVVQMLYGEDNMGAWAAGHPAEFPAGERWEYLSATTNILADVVKHQFDTDDEYWQYPTTALFEPLGIDSATLETDDSGTWVGSSYLWADVLDWARLGELMLNDGDWDGAEVLPAGWLDRATTQALDEGEGAGYGAQSWLPANPVGGECKDTPGIPEDTVSMEGHWGQLVVMIPSQDAVITRLGWTFDSDQFDGCQFIADVSATLG